jgi:hypothetical protein
VNHFPAKSERVNSQNFGETAELEYTESLRQGFRLETGTASPTISFRFGQKAPLAHRHLDCSAIQTHGNDSWQRVFSRIKFVMHTTTSCISSFGKLQVRHELRESGVDLVSTLIHQPPTLRVAAERIMVSVEASRAPEGSYSTQAERGRPHIPFP